jgi:uroporphyrinogen decarboxylase
MPKTENDPSTITAETGAMRRERARASGKRERFLAACRCEAVDRAPVWMMRQAGRALPEYRVLKEKHSFVEMVKTPDLAAEVTLQPVRRFGFDAAILFSDILVVPEAMGQGYQFRDSGGIEMVFALREAADIKRLDISCVAERLGYMADALRIIKRELASSAALIGFAGSPWTLANFMIEGGGATDWTGAKRLLRDDARLFEALMEKLTVAVIECLRVQIDAGAEAVQIFDTLGGLLPPERFAEASARWMHEIVAALPDTVPVIIFSKGANETWPALVNTGANVLGVDCTQSLAAVRDAFPANVGVQGNLDPDLLCAAPETAAVETRRILESMRGRTGHIFNLGHGVRPDARLESIAAVVKTVQDFH